MNENEWTTLTKHIPTEEEWNIIQLVYNFHPLIGDVNGKKQIAELFKMGGLGIIHDMFNTALEMSTYENELHVLRNEMHQATERYQKKVSTIENMKAGYRVEK